MRVGCRDLPCYVLGAANRNTWFVMVMKTFVRIHRQLHGSSSLLDLIQWLSYFAFLRHLSTWDRRCWSALAPPASSSLHRSPLSVSLTQRNSKDLLRLSRSQTLYPPAGSHCPLPQRGMAKRLSAPHSDAVCVNCSANSHHACMLVAPIMHSLPLQIRDISISSTV
jgi:hypothetical protein